MARYDEIKNENIFANVNWHKDLFGDIIGQEQTKQAVKAALMTGRHVIIIGPPGVGKTTLAKNLANHMPEIETLDCPYHCLPSLPVCPKCIKLVEENKQHNKKIKTIKVPGHKRFVRVQGSPDLTAEDLLGDIDPAKALKHGALSIEAFTPGKIFKANNGILFFDELNRCPEKLQNALLQVLSEGRATIGSYDIDFPANFVLIATMNPEDSSTEKLSDVLLDRFEMVGMSHPETLDYEIAIIKDKGKKFDISFPEELMKYFVSFVRELRENDNLEKKPSVRATIAIYELSQAFASLGKAKTVSYEHLQKAILNALPHRIRLKPSLRFLKTAKKFLTEELEKFSERAKGESMVSEGDVP